MQDTEFILHHYNISPYSQKIRAMLGYADLNWQSVLTTPAPPRPKLFPLTGGYRKIPVAQIGADIFCDSRLIAREIAQISKRQELQEEHLEESAKALMNKAEDELFFACGLSSTSLTVLWKTLRSFGLGSYINFMKDRIAMGKDSSMGALGIKESRQMVEQHLQIIEQQLTEDFLFGPTPNLADFAVYHGLWMVYDLGEKAFIRRFPNTINWIERINQFDTEAPVPMEADRALEVARNSTPRPIADKYQTDSAIGNKVAVGPTDYAKDTTDGELVGSTPYSWIVSRQHEAVDQVHVHFPKKGYALLAAK